MAPLPTALKVSPAAARRFMRRALLLDAPATGVAAALAHHGYVQIDPINVCGRMHDLILRNRVRAYREGDLMRHLHGDGAPLPAEKRPAFEHHFGVLVAHSLDAWPHLLAAMRARARRTSAWSGRLTPRERDLAPRLLAEIAARGPLNSDDFRDATSRRSKLNGWGYATLAKSTLQKLFFHGRLLIAKRDGARRFYDLPERVLPAHILALKEPARDETARWEILLKLRQRRLVLLKKTELTLVADLVQPVQVEGVPLLHCLRSDVPLFNAVQNAGRCGQKAPPLLLAPLDPLIYDRRITARLWQFDYTWEVYTPPAKRVRGYYALPLLADDELVGHVDPKADRPHRRLVVVSRRVRRGHSAAPAVRELARFLGLK